MRNRNNVSPLTPNNTVRKRRSTPPTMTTTSNDSSIIRYRALGANMVSLNNAGSVMARWYVGGMNARIANAAGPDVVSYYATCAFKPGTMVRWEPTTSPTAGGRMFVGFTDNPEVMVGLYNALEAYEVTPNSTTYGVYSNLVKGLCNMISFPMWQERDIPVPMRMRRKRFDCNQTVVVNDPNVMDRSAQVAMFACADGYSGISVSSTIGSFWYHDVVDVEGLSGTAT